MSSLLLRVLLIQLAAVECLSAAIPGCPTQCGGVEIPYPFGVGTNCSRKGFRIKCINGSAGEEIPVLLPTTRSQSMTFSSTWTRANQTFCPCDYAFIVEKGNYTFKASDLVSHTPDNRLPLEYWTMPLRLDWAIRDNGDSP